jgi:hypothetical protein
LTPERRARGESWGEGGGLSARSPRHGRKRDNCGEGDEANERGRANERVSADKTDPPGRERKEGASARGQTGQRQQGGPAWWREGAGAGLAWPNGPKVRAPRRGGE